MRVACRKDPARSLCLQRRAATLDDVSKTLPPGTMGRAPTELALGLGVRSCPRFGHHYDEVFARKNAGEPRRQMKRRFRPRHIGHSRKPFGHRCRVVIDDVVNSGFASRDGQRGRLRRISSVDERPPCRSTADQRNAAPTNLFEKAAVENTCIFAIERAVARTTPSIGVASMTVFSRYLIASSAGRISCGGLGSSGSFSVLTRPAVRA